VQSRTFTLGRYTCVERIGVTPVGEQWRAKRFGLIGVERQYLLTKLHPQLAKDPAAVAKLTAALKSYGELEHEGLLRFFEQGSQGGDHFAVFDFVGYADLRKLKAGLELLSSREKASALLPAIVVALGQELTAVLSRAHARGLLHGLLSPQSVWLDAQGGVHLADVGLGPTLPAASWASDPSLKAVYPYMAPELQISGAPTAQSDVYSLGMILQELLGGLTIASATAESAPVLGELMPVLVQATSRVASGRFATIAAFQQALQSVRLPMPEAVRSALQQVGQQFQMAGDTVPQPVVISERSSAEPLPPPPTGRVIIGKPGAPLRARAAASRPGLPADDALNLPPAGRDGPSRPGGAVHGDEDTPLPMSRPLLATNPRINLDGDGAGEAGAGPTRQSGNNEKLQRAVAAGGRSGPQAVTGAAAKPPSKPELKATEARGAIGQRPSSGPQAAVASPSPTSERPADAPKIGRSPASRGPASPVSINPKAQFGDSAGQPGRSAAGPAPRDSANTPTADLGDAVAAAGGGQELSWTPEAVAAATDGKPATGAYGHLLSPVDETAATDRHSAEQTNPALAPVRVGPPRPAAPPSDEPTNQLSSADARALAAAEAQAAEGRAGGSGPEFAQAGEAAGLGADAAAFGQPGFPGPAHDAAFAAGGEARAEGSGLMTAPVPAGRRSLLLGLGLLGLLGGGLLTYLVTRPGSTGGPGSASLDGGAGRADAHGTELAKTPAPTAPGELRLSSEPKAEVYLDKQPRGSTPLTLQLPPGPHKLLLIAEEYKLLRREVTAGAELSLKLERATLPDDVAGPQVVKIKCKTKEGLRILVDGNDTGLSCPTETLMLAPGRHTFSFLQPATEELQDKQQKVKSGKGATKIKVKF
jgi:serine/threonine protein kinase